MNADVTVREVMDREYVGVSESDPLLETVKLLLAEDADAALVLRGSTPVGVLTDRDVLAVLVDGPDPGEATAGDAMTPSVPTVDPDQSLPKAADRMSAETVRQLVVTPGNGEEPLGILTEHEVLASATYDPDSRPGPEQGDLRTTEAGGSMATDAEPESEASFEDQGICEVCGALSRDLASFNGQLVCTDCRSI